MSDAKAAPVTIEQVEAAQKRLLEAGRAAMGVTGDEQTEPFWASLRRHRVGVYPLAALGVLAVIDGFQLFAFTLLAPEISRGLGVPRGLVALLILFNQIALVLATLPIAGLVERRPLRALVAKTTGIVWSVATLVTGFVANPLQMAGVMVVDGATSGSVQAVHQPLLTDTYPPTVRGRVISGYQLFGAATGIASPLFLALLAGPFSLTWRGVFLAMGITCVACSLVALPLRDPGFGRWDAHRLREVVHQETQDAAPSDDHEEYQLRFTEILRRVWMVPTIRRILVGTAVLGLLAAPLNTFLAFFLEDRWGLDPAHRGLLFAYLPIFTLVLIAGLARFNERFYRSDPRKLLVLAAGLEFCAVIALVLTVIAPNFWMMVACLGLTAGFNQASFPPLATASLSIVRPQMRPHVSALTGIFYYAIGGIAGVALLSGLSDRYGVVFSLASTVLVVGTLACALFLSARRFIQGDLDRMVGELIEEEELQSIARSGGRLPMLACRKVSFAYGQLQVLFDVDFTVDEGEMVALLGTNGAGKSTLLRVISGLGFPFQGSIRFRGGDVTFLEPPRRVRLGITQVPGGRAVFGPMSVVENLRMFGYAHGRGGRELNRRLDESLDAFPALAQRRNQPASTLSGGEQQMLGLARALILQPRLLLVDELSLGLAPRVVSELLGMVRRINQAGTAIVLVEQSVNVALSLVEHAYFMERGEIRFDGPARELLERSDLLRSVFLEGATRGLAGARA